MKRYNLFLIFLLGTMTAFSQSQIVCLDSLTHGTTGIYCGYLFQDDGGIGQNYSINYDRWITLKGDSNTNNHVRLFFSSFSIASDDTLFIYDGPTITSPLIGKYNNNLNPLINGNSMVYSSLSNTSGCLTVRFKSNSSNTSTGWNASVICSVSCQEITPQLDTSLFSPHLTDSLYVDICLGESITFAALGSGPTVFPQNDFSYHQDSSNCQFIWNFGDGTSATGQVVSHTYTIANGYNVTLSILDEQNCMSQQPKYLRVRISKTQILNINPPSTICLGDTLFLTYGTNPSDVIVLPAYAPTEITGRYDSVTYIPDGPSCSQQCYRTPIILSGFSSDAVIQSAQDIKSICINMEHSFAGDLSFGIICPNGQEVVLDSYDNGGGSFLGQADDMNDGSNPCLASDNPPGTGWTYCWSELYPQAGTLNTLDAGTSPIPATDTINNTGYITPENPLYGLIGCPLNGTWSIEICDNWGMDNGYVFWWELNLKTNYTGWNYNVSLDSVVWNGYNIHQTGNLTYMIADSSGSFPYQVTIYDAFGCSATDYFYINVGNSILGPDTVICHGQTITLSLLSGNSYLWSTGETSSNITVSPLGDTSYSVTVFNSDSCTAIDSIFISVLDSLPSALFTYTHLNNNYTFTDVSQHTTSWFWNFGDGNTSVAQNPTHTYQSNGIYTVQLIASNPCGKDTFATQVEVTYVKPDFINNNIIVSPNPSNDIVNITFPKEITGKIKLSIYTIYGDLLLVDEQSNKRYYTVNISNLSDGIYILKIHYGNNVVMKKIIKSK